MPHQPTLTRGVGTNKYSTGGKRRCYGGEGGEEGEAAAEWIQGDGRASSEEEETVKGFDNFIMKESGGRQSL